jgi:DNA repair protein RadC
MKTINQWPTSERPREKLLERGAESLSDAELLAIFLRTGVKNKTAVDLGRDLIHKFGTLKKIFAADLKTFCADPGLGRAKYAQLQAALEIARRCLYETVQHQDALENSRDTYVYLSAKLQNYPYEVFACLFLDRANRPISFDELFRGTIDQAAVYPREIIARTLMHQATSVILAHNHPSGQAQPSTADIRFTLTFKETLNSINVQLLDHIIVGMGQVFSFLENGLLVSKEATSEKC